MTGDFLKTRIRETRAAEAGSLGEGCVRRYHLRICAADPVPVENHPVQPRPSWWVAQVATKRL
jgi:hypothetical protein